MCRPLNTPGMPQIPTDKIAAAMAHDRGLEQFIVSGSNLRLRLQSVSTDMSDVEKQ